jgi:biopolymer transport protein ExbB
MKKSGMFSAILITVAIVAALIIYIFILGNPGNFIENTPVPKSMPKEGNWFGVIYTGGPVVVALLALLIMVSTYTIERILSLGKAKGKGPIEAFLKNIQMTLRDGDIEGTIALCDKQKGSIANILKQGLERYQSVNAENKLDSERKLEEVKNAIEEAMGLELPLLNRNLSALATIASISVLFGLFGTVLGMIRSFRELAVAGTPDPSKLSLGISEALINTAFGLAGAIIGTISYNFFLTKVGSITYMIDEATYNLLAIIAYKSK